MQMNITGKEALGEWNRRRSVFGSHRAKLIVCIADSQHGYRKSQALQEECRVFSMGHLVKPHSRTDCREVPDLKYPQTTGKECPGLDYSSARMQLLFIWQWAQAYWESHYGFVVLAVQGKTKWPGNHIMELHEICLRCSHPCQGTCWLHMFRALAAVRSQGSTGDRPCFVKQEWSSAGGSASLM